MASKTDLFKTHLQLIVQQQTGMKVSKEVAWKLFKAFNMGTVQFVLNNDENTADKEVKAQLSLAGVGIFKVAKSNPTGSKAGLKQVPRIDVDGNEVLDVNGKVVKDWAPDPDAVAWDFAPKFKFQPSSTINDYVNTFYGHPDEKTADKVAKIQGVGLYANTEKKEAVEVDAVDTADMADLKLAPETDDIF